MAKDKITEYDSNASLNTVVGDVNLQESSMLPSEVNNAIREVMSHQKEAFGSGTPLFVDQTNNRVGIGTTTTPSAQLHISGTDTSDQVIIENTDTGGGSAPDLVLFRNSASPADNDVIGRIDFRGDDDNGTARDYVTLFSTITDASTGTPAGSFSIQTRNGSSQTTRLIVGGSGNVGIGTSDTTTSGQSGKLKVRNDVNYTSTEFEDDATLVLQNEEDNHSATLVFHSNNSSGSSKRSGIVGGNINSNKEGLGFYGSIANKTISSSPDVFIDSSGNVGIGTSSPTVQLHVKGTASANNAEMRLEEVNGDIVQLISIGNEFRIGTVAANPMAFRTGNTERMRILSNGVCLFGKSTDDNGIAGAALSSSGNGFVRSGAAAASFNRIGDDGEVVRIQQAGTTEGNITVSGSTVEYNGFSGLHESSGIATDTPIGTVISTINELDVYFAKQGEADSEEDNPKSGQTRADHAKVKVSDTEGDKAVYGVVKRFNAQGKVNVASVGIGSVRVTGACEKGDLLESNGDGTAKVQSDDIVRSKTIGKVTIGNSSTDVKLVSCVLYCG